MPAKPSLGLYFTDNFIEISQVSSDGTRLDRFNQMSLLQGLVVNSEIKDVAAFTTVLRQLLGTAKPSPISPSAEIVIGVNDNRVFLREFVVTSVPGQNLNDAIEYQVRSLLPVLPAGVETDWQIIGKNTDGQIEVLLSAIPRNIIESYVSVCTGIGLRVIAVEPAVFANIRIIDPVQIQGKNQLLVHLGDSFGVFSYITSGNPRFSDFLPQSEIEKNGDIAKSIQAYVNFANSKHPNRPVQEVLISGSRQDIQQTVSELRAQGIPAVKAGSRLGHTGVLNHSLLHTGHGLSLKTLVLGQTLNLLPIDFRMDVMKGRYVNSWKALLYFLIFLTILGIGGQAYLYANTIDRQTRLLIQKDQSEQQLKLPESVELIKQTDRLNMVTGQLVTLRNVVGSEENILKELSALTPNGIVLSTLIYARNPGVKKLTDPGNSWIITGTAISRPLVLDFYEKLISSAEFSGGQLYFGSLEKDTGLTFRIASQLIKK